MKYLTVSLCSQVFIFVDKDNWKSFKIGDVILRQLKECDRSVDMLIEQQIS